MGTTEAKLPRSVRKGPLITVTCECGERRYLHYGERWQCEACGRNFDTHKIPLEEYAAIRRTQLRHRIFPLLSGLLLLGAVIAMFALGNGFRGLVLVAFVIASWGMVVRPFFRSRYRRKLTENLPTWTIEGD